MATAEQIKALFRSHSEGDEERFYAIAMQIAAQAARKGHGKLAKELRDLIDEAKSRRDLITSTSTAIPVVKPRGELSGLLSVEYTKTRLSDMVLSDDLRTRIQRILREQRQQNKLRNHGLSPRRKLLLVGPPGTGKTMTAAALAGELHLPLFKILLDGLITKFMGETAAKLRIVFDAIARTRGVYLFDEFDAIGGQRTLGNDVGEIRRILNSFLQFLEQDISQSLIVSATNNPSLLDTALFRRFDDVIEYALPAAVLIKKTFHSSLAVFNTHDVQWEKVIGTAEGLSHADITRVCENVAKQAVLGDSDKISTDPLIVSIFERKAAHR